MRKLSLMQTGFATSRIWMPNVYIGNLTYKMNDDCTQKRLSRKGKPFLRNFGLLPIPA